MNRTDITEKKGFGLEDGLTKIDPTEQSGKQKSLQNSISIINQCQFNLDNTPLEEIKNENSEKMLKFKEGVLGFDVQYLVKNLTLRVNKLEKTKNIVVKELQSLKAYSMDKADRAQISGKAADFESIKGVIDNLQRYIEMINTNLTYILQEYLDERLQNLAWIGIENDFNDNFLDL